MTTKLSKMISEKTPLSNTWIERQLKIILEDLEVSFVVGFLLEVKDKNEKVWTLRPDVYIPEKRIVLEANGPHHYRTRGRSRDKWRTNLLLENGCCVIQINYKSFTMKYRESLKTTLKDAIENRKTVKIDRRNFR